MTDFEDFIAVYDYAYTPEFCNEILNFYNYCYENKIVDVNVIDSGSRTNSELIRKDTSIFCSSPKSLEALSKSDYFPILPVDARVELFNVLNPLITEYRLKYNIAPDLYCNAIKMHQVRESEGYFTFHYENHDEQYIDSQAHRRILTWMFYVEEPEEGGETEFLNQRIRITPKVGRLLIWPAHFTHLHRGNPVLRGRKTYVTSWYICL